MIENAQVSIRPFRNTRADAKGILAVEKATFAECPYDADQVRDLLADERQRAWVAVSSQGVVGFVISFLTEGLARRWWEIDLLAVLPTWRGKGLATRMIQAAAETGATQAPQARAFTADDNVTSAGAFRRAGFCRSGELFELLIHRTEDPAPIFRPVAGVSIRTAAGGEELAPWLDGYRGAGARTLDLEGRAWAADATPRPLSLPPDPHGLTLLLAERDGKPAGYAELVRVETLLYQGYWIEELAAVDRWARQALVQEVTSLGRRTGVDEIGAMVPHSNGRLRRELLCSGYRSLGSYHRLTAELPLPDPDSARPDRPAGADLA